jgi:hypothetical protein
MRTGTLRVFLKWAASIDAVPENLYDKVMVPRVRPEQRQRDETLDAERAQEILTYLAKSRTRRLSTFCWHYCGRRGFGSEQLNHSMSTMTTSRMVTSGPSPRRGNPAEERNGRGTAGGANVRSGQFTWRSLIIRKKSVDGWGKSSAGQPFEGLAGWRLFYEVGVGQRARTPVRLCPAKTV